MSVSSNFQERFGIPALASPGTKVHIREESTFPATLVGLYIFLLASRVLDVSFMGYYHIPLTLLIILTILTLAKGDFQYGLSSKVTKYFLAFTGWVIIAWPFSMWRSGSLETVELQLQALLIFFIILQLVRTRKDWEKVTSGYAYATLAASIMSFFIGVAVEGRVALPGGSLGDPNAFAMFMVVGLPFWWLKASRSTGLKKILLLLCTLPIYPAFARAGSRSGMLAMTVLLAATFFFAQGGRKVLIAVLAVCGVLAATVLLPGYLRARFMTFFASDAEYSSAMKQRLGADIQSSEGRRELLFQSIRMTFEHPLLGIGPGVFYIVGYEQRKAQSGSGGQAYQTHNTYTQISSETGFPGFFLFLGTVALCFQYTLHDYRKLKAADAEFAQYGRYMVSSMAALSLGIFFLSVGYTYLLSIVFAFATALHMMVKRYIAQIHHSPDQQILTTGKRSRTAVPAPGANLQRRPPRKSYRRPPNKPKLPVHLDNETVKSEN